ncbi:HalOD1 output domain-containing protein [Halomarina rubra]|uniref:HalOD1 output domain-containing protein n=1 Tax=Halomarina rubra TaxID=2071873 RepID=A0ABD6AWR4_9EURY|nr:HalOD1 output domain-containing protein [Halomarina rubra]
MDGPSRRVDERTLVGDPVATSRFAPGEGVLLSTVVDLVETERPVGPTETPPLGESVDWDALDRLLDDEGRAMNVASVTFSYDRFVVRISGDGRVELYDDPGEADTDDGDDGEEFHAGKSTER